MISRTRCYLNNRKKINSEIDTTRNYLLHIDISHNPIDSTNKNKYYTNFDTNEFNKYAATLIAAATHPAFGVNSRPVREIVGP